MKREPYPLQWPEGWKRTTYRGAPKFVGQFSRDRDSVIRQLKMRGGNHITITSDLPTRNDGLPYANATCSDPGIAVWWVERGKEQVMACDRWQKVIWNMRAIDMTLEALRGIDRWGSSQMVERAFAGFAALPAAGETGGRSWRDVLGDCADIEAARFAYRALMRDNHPDQGGTHERAVELNAAIAAAETELS